MDDGVGISVASEGIDLFVGLWEAQLCFWDPDDDEVMLNVLRCRLTY